MQSWSYLWQSQWEVQCNMFNENSIVVKVWADAVLKGDKELSDVPNLSNLIAVVTILVEGGENNV